MFLRPANRNAVIRAFKDAGYSILRGVPIEERILATGDTYTIKQLYDKHFKKYWKEIIK